MECAGALTPPRRRSDAKDVDMKGPGGFTPLMIASFCGSSSLPDTDSTTDGSTDLDAAAAADDGIITDLINHGAAVNAKTDRTGALLFSLFLTLIQ